RGDGASRTPARRDRSPSDGRRRSILGRARASPAPPWETADTTGGIPPCRSSRRAERRSRTPRLRQAVCWRLIGRARQPESARWTPRRFYCDAAAFIFISIVARWIEHQSLCSAIGMPHSTHTRTRCFGGSLLPNSRFKNDMPPPERGDRDSGSGFESPPPLFSDTLDGGARFPVDTPPYCRAW